MKKKAVAPLARLLQGVMGGLFSAGGGRQGAPPVARAAAAAARRDPQAFHLERLGQYGLLGRLPEGRVQGNARSARVYYARDAFPDPRVLPRLLTKVPAVCVGADAQGVMLDGRPIPGPDFFRDLETGDPRGLSPAERRLSRKKVIASESTVFQFGGYPALVPVIPYPTPRQAIIVSQAGPSFEQRWLDYNRFIVDPTDTDRYQKVLALSRDPKYAGDWPFLPHPIMSYLVRDPGTGKLGGSFYKTNALIFDRDAYFASAKEDLLLFFAAIDDMISRRVGGKDEKAHVKATAMGMGHFARIEGIYDISNKLAPVYMHALHQVLSTYKFPHIAAVEVPAFTEELQFAFEMAFETVGKAEVQGIQVCCSGRDVLDFLDIPDGRMPGVGNPSDTNALPGNEMQYASVEGAIGLNTTLAMDQVFLVNPDLLLPHRHIGVVRTPTGFEYDRPVEEEVVEKKTCKK